MINRRKFIQQSSISGLGLALGVPATAMLSRGETTRITVLHTNDWHSRIDPFPQDGGRNAGKGGIERRAAAVQAVRAAEDHVLLLDSGDIFQGTPYFNFFGGELEFKLMSELGYDAATMGNHDFDNGLDGLDRVLPNATFPLVISNYDMSDTALHDKTLAHLTKSFGDVRVGIFGVGIELSGLVPSRLYGATKYLDPVMIAQQMADRLRYDYKCDYIICLSHLGFRYRNDKIDDLSLASATSGIDLILGGHTHTFLTKPELVSDIKGDIVIVNQAGWAGILLGRIDLLFEKNRKGKCVSCGYKEV